MVESQKIVLQRSTNKNWKEHANAEKGNYSVGGVYVKNTDNGTREQKIVKRKGDLLDNRGGTKMLRGLGVHLNNNK